MGKATIVAKQKERDKIRIQQWLAARKIDCIDKSTVRNIADNFLLRRKRQVFSVSKMSKAIFASIIAFFGDMKIDFQLFHKKARRLADRPAYLLHSSDDQSFFTFLSLLICSYGMRSAMCRTDRNENYTLRCSNPSIDRLPIRFSVPSISYRRTPESPRL